VPQYHKYSLDRKDVYMTSCTIYVMSYSIGRERRDMLPLRSVGLLYTGKYTVL